MGFSLSFTLFFVVTTFYVVIVDVFTMLFRITGLTASQARFQTISLLTNSGYTTNESELVVDVLQRRHLARTIMLFGYIFNITVVSVFVNMMLQLPSSMKAELWPVLIIVGVLFVVFIFVRRIPVVRQAFNTVVEQWGRQWMYGKEGNTIMLQDEYAHGVMAAVHFNEVPAILKGKSVQEWNGGDDHGIYVLYINRDGHLLMKTEDQAYFQQGDLVTVYGDLDTIRTLFGNAQKNRTSMPRAPKPISEQEYIHNEDVKEAKEAARQAREHMKDEVAKTQEPIPHEEQQAKKVLEQIRGILLGGPGKEASHAAAATAASNGGATKTVPKAVAQEPVVSEKPAVAGRIADLLEKSEGPTETTSGHKTVASQPVHATEGSTKPAANAGEDGAKDASSGAKNAKQSAQIDTDTSASSAPGAAGSKQRAKTDAAAARRSSSAPKGDAPAEPVGGAQSTPAKAAGHGQNAARKANATKK